MTEEWRDVPGYPGYSISRGGRVRGRRGSVMSPCADQYGHLSIMASVNGKPKKLWLHRGLLLAFVGDPEEGELARHLDGDATNNDLSNLAWGTPADNGQDAARHGSQKGRKNPRNLLTEEEVWEIRSLEGDMTAPQVAELFNVTRWAVYAIWHRKTWRWLREPDGSEFVRRKARAA